MENKSIKSNHTKNEKYRSNHQIQSQSAKGKIKSESVKENPKN